MVKLLSKKMCLTLLAAAASVASFAGVAKADLVGTNGSFESWTGGYDPGSGAQPSQLGTVANSTQLTGWSVPGGTNTSYAFLFGPGTADTTGSYTYQWGGPIYLWGPGNGALNGLPASSPDGGNFVAMDSVYERGALSQTITGIVVGDTYRVGFWMAAAQQKGYDGVTSDVWNVSFGSSSYVSSTMNVGNHGYSPWQYVSVDFIADSTTETLSFISLGTPGLSEPPFALLDGVTVDHLPVPPGAVLAMTGLCMLVGYSTLRKAKAAKKVAALA